jgi:hypothetical protein
LTNISVGQGFRTPCCLIAIAVACGLRQSANARLRWSTARARLISLIERKRGKQPIDIFNQFGGQSLCADN